MIFVNLSHIRIKYSTNYSSVNYNLLAYASKIMSIINYLFYNFE